MEEIKSTIVNQENNFPLLFLREFSVLLISTVCSHLMQATLSKHVKY